ncbi:MAG: hypothetical protein RJA76_732, partial [Bacteroidota bacterium]
MYQFSKKTLLSLFLLSISFVGFGQSGILKGTLTDSKSKESLIGATVRIE